MPLDREEVRTVVRAKMSDLRRCFDATLALAPEIGGRLVVQFTIGPDGRARQVEIVSDELGEPQSLEGPRVGACVSEQISTWQFPRPREGSELTIAYPFVFSSEASLRAAGLPRVEGTVKPAAVGAVFDARRSELDECVDEAQAGTIGVALVIDEGGAVTRISAYQTSLSRSSTSCVLRTISSWRFPPAAPSDEARVNHDLAWGAP